MSKHEDYLLGRIAQLEGLVNNHGGDKGALPGWRAMLTEARLTLKKLREITKGKAG